MDNAVPAPRRCAVREVPESSGRPPTAETAPRRLEQRGGVVAEERGIRAALVPAAGPSQIALPAVPPFGGTPGLMIPPDVAALSAAAAWQSAFAQTAAARGLATSHSMVRTTAAAPSVPDMRAVSATKINRASLARLPAPPLDNRRTCPRLRRTRYYRGRRALQRSETLPSGWSRCFHYVPVVVAARRQMVGPRESPAFALPFTCVDRPPRPLAAARAGGRGEEAQAEAVQQGVGQAVAPPQAGGERAARGQDRGALRRERPAEATARRCGRGVRGAEGGGEAPEGAPREAVDAPGCCVLLDSSAAGVAPGRRCCRRDIFRRRVI